MVAQKKVILLVTPPRETTVKFGCHRTPNR
nr:MAG TPA: hypothetical protein [Inoviridae sp.]